MKWTLTNALRWQTCSLRYTRIYIHFGGLLPLMEFCQVQNSLCVQVVRYPILAALLHSSRAVGVSQTLRRGTRNGIAELSLLVIFNRRRHLYSEGGHHVGHKAHILVLFCSCTLVIGLPSVYVLERSACVNTSTAGEILTLATDIT